MVKNAPTDKKSDKSIDKDLSKSEKKTKKSKSWIKWVGLGMVIFIAFVAFGFYQDKKAMEERRESMEKQRQVMVDHWISQGLSEADALQKIQEEGGQRIEGFEPTLFQQVMRTVRQATGSTGPGGGRGMGDGSGAGLPH